jgi:hypothetical protein
VIPTLDELGSDALVHRPADVFNPPALTNFLGCVQVAVDPVALWNLNFPPLACGEVASGHLFVDGWLFAASGEPVGFRWFPDRVERSATFRGLEITSTTVLGWRQTAAIVHLAVRNTSGVERQVRLGLAVQGSISHVTEPWHRAQAPSESVPASTPDGMLHDPGPLGSASRSVDERRGAVAYRSPSGAASIQGSVPAGRTDGRLIEHEITLEPGGRWEMAYVHSVADDHDAALTTYDAIAADVDGALRRVRDEWQAELGAIFTPGGDRYSGSMPTLETDDADLRRLYHMGVLGVAYFKRQNPRAAVGRAYDTLMPRYWATNTYIWDYSLSSTVHALLDPVEMRGQVERWMAIDVHAAYGSDWLTGSPVGMWYSVNDHAMTQLVDTYLTWTGDDGWLDATVRGADGQRPTVADQLQRYATSWRDFASAAGLADYGGIGNLLECVSSYVHEVAALNAANVWNLRRAADHLARRDSAVAAGLRKEADGLVDRLWSLYQEGEGWFNARQPDGRLLAVRHCYDLLQLLCLLPGDIDERRRNEMVEFFRTQLQTPTWMRALSPADADAVSSVRPDHQWNGSYTAWPAYVAMGLFNIDRAELASSWLRGLAQSANQGPFAQAHFVEEFLAADAGGAIKASSEWPYINDWACSSGGAWARLVIEGVFGLVAGGDTPAATPRLAHLDTDARLVGLPYRGRLYTVDRTGVSPQRAG